MYKGAPLDAECGPGLGCFWIQVVTLVALLVLTPLTVILAFPSWVSAALLILTLAILFFVGQTTIFLLRLVAADRRAARRVPRSASARRTVGQLEDDAAGRTRLSRREGMPTFAALMDTIIDVHGPNDARWQRYWSDVYDGRAATVLPDFWLRLRRRAPRGTVRDVVAAWSPNELRNLYDELLWQRDPKSSVGLSDQDDAAPR